MKKLLYLDLLLAAVLMAVSCSDYDGDLSSNLGVQIDRLDPADLPDSEIEMLVSISDSLGRDLLNPENENFFDASKIKVECMGNIFPLNISEVTLELSRSIAFVPMIISYNINGPKRYYIYIGQYNYYTEYIDEKAIIHWDSSSSDTLSFDNIIFRDEYGLISKIERKYYLNGVEHEKNIFDIRK